MRVLSGSYDHYAKITNIDNGNNEFQYDYKNGVVILILINLIFQYCVEVTKD